MFCKVLKTTSVAVLVFLAGCTTEAAKKAMDRPMPKDQYTGFDSEASDTSKRKAEKPKAVRADMAPEEAVATLVKQMQDKSNPSAAASYIVTAEEQLQYWGSRPGVAPIVVRGVRPLLKSKSVEQRAPALRLTVMFGGADSLGDLIECLADNEYGIREMAYRAVLSYKAPRDFSYDPQGGEVARAQSVDQYRRWWQYESRKGTVQPPSIYEEKPPMEATVKTPRQRQAVTSDADNRR